MHGMVFVAVVFIVLVSGSVANRLRVSNMDVCSLPDICGEHGECKMERHISFCVCQPGFTGKCCESYIPKRCKLYSEDTKEETHLKKDLNESEEENFTCEENFWCVADNFYCNLFHCDNSEGWCIPVTAEKQVPDCKLYAKYLQ